MYHNSNVLVTGGTANYIAGDFVQKNEPRGFERLEKHVAAGALHNSGEVSDQPKCHPGTRVAILEHLEAWARALTYIYPILWLHGPAGAGKSAILRTIAKILFDQGLLLASFFFFRSAARRNSSDHFIATIAYQLARAIPATRPHIEQALEREPLMFSLSLWDQAEALIISPILAVYRDNPCLDPSQIPRIIIVDGLDECYDPDKQCELLQILCHILQRLPVPLAVLVASRPEHHIRGAFDLGDLNKLSSRLALDDSYEPDVDIKKYLRDRFRSIQENHPLKTCLPTSSPWPSQDVVSKLVAKASGQFIFASTVVKFVSSIRHNPAKRLDMILGTIDAGNLKPFEQLDNLYSTIFSTVDPCDLVGTLRILGVLLVPYQSRFSTIQILRSSINFQEPKFLQRLLNLDIGDIRHLLFDLESLLTIGNDDDAIRFFHASLGDYLFDRSRSDRFWIDAGLVYADLAEQCTIRFTDCHDLNWLKDLNRFFYLNSFSFFSKATPTLRLRKAIENCDLAKVVDVSLWDPGQGSSHISPTLLQAICNSTFSDAQDLYLTKLASYAEIIGPRIHFYFQSDALKHFLIAAVSVEVADEKIDKHYECLRHIFHISGDMWDIQKRQGLNLEHSDPALRQVLKEILDGDSYSTVDSFVDDDYAEVALYLVKLMEQAPRYFLHNDRYQNLGEARQIVNCLSEVFPVLLSKSLTRYDIRLQIKNTLIHPSYLEFTSIKPALEAYLLRSANQSRTVYSRASVSRHQDKSNVNSFTGPVVIAEAQARSKVETGLRQTHRKPWYRRWSLRLHTTKGPENP